MVYSVWSAAYVSSNCSGSISLFCTFTWVAACVLSFFDICTSIIGKLFSYRSHMALAYLFLTARFVNDWFYCFIADVPPYMLKFVLLFY